jgi:hypothetical protein
MATMKKAAPKAQKGKKVSVMKAYVDKYKNEGGISNMDVARDTLGGSSPRNNQYSGGFGGGRMNQIKDLQAAHDKKFGKKSTIDERKTGGPIKKAQKGASMEDPFARKLPKKVGVLPSTTKVEKDTTTNSTRRQLLDGFQKGPSPSKRKYKTGGVIKKAQKGKKLPLGASSASAEKDYTKSDSLMNVIKNTTKKDNWYMTKSGKNIPNLYKSADSLSREGDRKTKATGGVRKGLRFKNGGSLSALSASNKRDKGIDPKGAFTKVQKKTLAGAKGKASLTKDKQLGATKMAKRGMSIKKK